MRMLGVKLEDAEAGAPTRQRAALEAAVQQESETAHPDVYLAPEVVTPEAVAPAAAPAAAADAAPEQFEVTLRQSQTGGFNVAFSQPDGPTGSVVVASVDAAEVEDDRHLMQVGDIVHEANGCKLSGLLLAEVRNVVAGSSSELLLIVHHPTHGSPPAPELATSSQSSSTVATTSQLVRI